VRTLSDWQNPPPGFVEADLVAHSGPSASGSFVQTLVLTDVATGWTECAPLLVREQNVLSEVLTELRKPLPFDAWDHIQANLFRRLAEEFGPLTDTHKRLISTWSWFALRRSCAVGLVFRVDRCWIAPRWHARSSPKW
jgi:hypothetical protein